MGLKVLTQPILDLAKAVAFAEGFGVKNAVPTRAHNPGDLKVPNWQGPTLGAEGISVFPDDESGWNALHTQLIRIQSGASHVYYLDMPFSEFAARWTDTQSGAWLKNVLDYLTRAGYKIDETTTLGDYFNSYLQ